MAKKERIYNYVIHVKMPDGTVRDWDDMTEQEKQFCRDRWAARLSENMSAYYAAHPDEYALL